MKNVISLYKPVGFTPLQIITILRKQYPEYAQTTLGYAGRLDPMADGLLLVLVGEENKERKKYEDLPKEYACDVLFGIATDTYDILGKITQQTLIHTDITESIQELLPTFLGKQTQPYPPYSSQPVKGKPLYYWARNNKLSDIEIPTKNIEIYTITLLSQKEISTNELHAYISNRIPKVRGDFRQEEILAIWDNVFKQNTQHTQQTFPVFRFTISCSSGTYIRSFAHNLGQKLQTGALALSITRTKVGTHDLQDVTKLAIL